MTILKYKKEDTTKMKVIIILIWAYSLVFMYFSFQVLVASLGDGNVVFGAGIIFAIIVFLLHLGLLLKISIAKSIILFISYSVLIMSSMVLAAYVFFPEHPSIKESFESINGGPGIKYFLLIIYILVPLLINYLFQNKEAKEIYS